MLEARGARPEPRHPGLVELRQRLASGAPDVVDRALADRELLDFYDEQTGCTPALAALVQGDRRMAAALLTAKERPDINEAAAFGDVAALEALLDDHDITGPRAGAGPPFVPLHFAAWGGELPVAEVLLARGYSAAAVNRADEAGKYQGMRALRDTTPLHVAADAGQAALLERLLDAWNEHWQTGNG